MGASTASSVVVDAPGSTYIPVNIEAVTQPVADTSRRIYQSASDGVHWYVEQWEDLLIEAKHAALGANAHCVIDDVLAGLDSAKVASDIPGRLRVRTKLIKWQDQLAAQCAAAIGAMPGVQQVDASSLTGSILVHYDASMYASGAELLQVISTLSA